MSEFIYSIRYNKAKVAPKISNQVAWENAATYINKLDFILEPEWHAGSYYVQESSSMFLGYILEQISVEKQDVIALDLCAAPGGKSTHILDKLNKNSILISNELVPKRNAILKENLIRWGNSNVIVTQNETKYFNSFNQFFDVVVVDAPCSGEGLFKRNPDAMKEWSEENVAMCATRQREILQHIIPAIREDGYLIYSTCTFQQCENEDQISFLLQNGFELVDIDASTFEEISSGSIKNTFRFELEKVKGSGFFIACLRKIKSSNNYSINQTNKIFYNKIETIQFKNLGEWIENSEQYNTYSFKENLYIINKKFDSILYAIKNNLYITYFGVEIGILKKDIFIPAHALALSTVINKSIDKVEVDKKIAVNYLKKNEIQLEYNKQKSTWCIIQHVQLNLGWIKILQNRVNNYLPNHWRILKQ